MVCVLGMSDRVGLQRCARLADGVFQAGPGGWLRDCSEATAREIDEEVRRLLDEASARARSILAEDRATLESVARVLLERETLDRAAFQALVEARPLGGAAADPRASAALAQPSPRPAAASGAEHSLTPT
jgi:cell division protease FtsH